MRDENVESAEIEAGFSAWTRTVCTMGVSWALPVVIAEGFSIEHERSKNSRAARER